MVSMNALAFTCFRRFDRTHWVQNLWAADLATLLHFRQQSCVLSIHYAEKGDDHGFGVGLAVPVARVGGFARGPIRGED